MSLFGMLDGVPDSLPTLIDEEDLLFGGEKTFPGTIVAVVVLVQCADESSCDSHSAV